MDGLRPVGSEAIKDPDKKLGRILEIAGIKKNTEITSNQNVDVKTKKMYETVLHTAVASNGVKYGIVQEGKHVYLKQAINGYFEYIGGVQNLREHSYKNYSDALKHLNLLFKDINQLTETKEGTNILGEGYKLKVGSKESSNDFKPEQEPGFGDNSSNMAQEPSDDSSFDFPQNQDNLGVDQLGNNDNQEGGKEELTSTKKVQKLAGKLAQEIRDAKEGEIDNKVAKSVTNTVLSATLDLLGDDDKTSIVNKLENGEDEEADGDENFDLDNFKFDDQDNDTEPGNEEGLKEADVEEHNEPFDPSPMSKPGDHEVHLGEADVEEHNEPFDPSPMSKPGDHEVIEEDPYGLFETALNAIMEKASKHNDLKSMKQYMGEMWEKIQSAYNTRKYESMGKLAESLADMDEHNEPFDPSPMSKPGDHEVHESIEGENAEQLNEKFESKDQQGYFYARANDPSLTPDERAEWKKRADEFSSKTDFDKLPNSVDEERVGLSVGFKKRAGAKINEEEIENEHNEPADPSPMSKPGDHEVHLEETDEKTCEKCGKKICECGDQQAMVNESLEFLKNKINEIRKRLVE